MKTVQAGSGPVNNVSTEGGGAVERTEAVAIPTCGSCRAFLRDGDLGDLEPPYGECRRRCPQVLPEEPGVHDAVWPTVNGNRAGCWDHLPIETPR